MHLGLLVGTGGHMQVGDWVVRILVFGSVIVNLSKNRSNWSKHEEYSQGRTQLYVDVEERL